MLRPDTTHLAPLGYFISYTAVTVQLSLEREQRAGKRRIRIPIIVAYSCIFAVISYIKVGADGGSACQAVPVHCWGATV